MKPPRGERSDSLGKRLRSLRTAARLSQRTVAARAGFTPGFLSQVELGLASPSIGSLEKLADAIGVGLAGLFAPAASAPRGVPSVLSLAGGDGHRSAWSKTRLEVLRAPEGNDHLEVLVMWIEPGGRAASRATAAQEQVAILLAGRLELEQDERKTSIRRGEAVHLPLGTAHAWSNASRSQAHLLLVRLSTDPQTAGTAVPRRKSADRGATKRAAKGGRRA